MPVVAPNASRDAPSTGPRSGRHRLGFRCGRRTAHGSPSLSFSTLPGLANGATARVPNSSRTSTLVDSRVASANLVDVATADDPLLRLRWLAVARPRRLARRRRARRCGGVVGARRSIDRRCACVSLAGRLGGWARRRDRASPLRRPVSLTVVRAIVPLSVVAGVVAWIAGAPAASRSCSCCSASSPRSSSPSAEFGAAMVQASAYGDETRLGLRPPLGFVVATLVDLGDHRGARDRRTAARRRQPRRIGGADGPRRRLLAAGTSLALWVFPRRWHLLSRRWLVFVPAGVVVHDRVVLAETLMLRRVEVERDATRPRRHRRPRPHRPGDRPRRRDRHRRAGHRAARTGPPGATVTRPRPRRRRCW